jgi:hypothetical protein
MIPGSIPERYSSGSRFTAMKEDGGLEKVGNAFEIGIVQRDGETGSPF